MLMMQGEHEEQIRKLKKDQSKRIAAIERNHSQRVEDLQEINRRDRLELKRDFYEVVGKLTEISIVPDPEKRDCWRIVVDFNSHMFSRALMRGNDNRMIYHIGDAVAHKVMRELTTINITRPETIGLRRG